MERIVVIVTREEKREIKREAGIASMSAWIRSVVLEKLNGDLTGTALMMKTMTYRKLPDLNKGGVSKKGRSK